MKEMVLLGDEALALGALHAGLTAGFGYPGTPSTEIMEYLIDNYEKHGPSAGGTAPLAQWCSNEKTAYESALGASFAGVRSIVTMKHVGLNVAADPFMNSSLVGIKGGLIVVVADDPSMHSSQGEQDTRYYADFAMVPCMEPTTQQEAYEMVFEAFDLSERLQVPVIIRMVTRLAHSRAVVRPVAEKKVRARNKVEKADRKDWMLLPAFSRVNYAKMLQKQPELVAWSEKLAWSPLVINPNRSDLAIITSGLGKNYFLENLEDYSDLCDQKYKGKGLPSTLHVGSLPLPLKSLKKIAAQAKTLLVIEEGMPFIEKHLRGVLPQENEVIGKLTGHLPRTGELNPDFVRKALGLEPTATAEQMLKSNPEFDQTAQICGSLPGRPPQLCKGCPHGDSYTVVNRVVEKLVKKAGKDMVAVTADIGCYSLGAAPPYTAIETIVCMGASIGMARGAALSGVQYAIGVIGDSTFLHSGISNLVDAVSSKAPMTAIILDNSIVGMTGCQQTILPSSKLRDLVAGLGVEPDHIQVLAATPAKIEENAAVLEAEMEYRGVSVIIMVRECLEAFRLRRKKEQKKSPNSQGAAT